MTTTRPLWFKRGISVVLAVMMVLSMGLINVTAQGNNQDNGFKDGVYHVQVNLWQAIQNQQSMGNAAVRGSNAYNEKHAEDDADYRPLLIVKDGKGTLIMEYVAMGFLGTYGYLLELNTYTYSGEHDNSAGFPQNQGGTLTPTEVLAEHRMTDGSIAYDYYNDPESESVLEEAKNRAYPHVLAVPVELPEQPVTQSWDEAQWVQVYVPVMGSISLPSARQQARLWLDYDNMTEVTDLSGEVEYWLWQAMQTPKGTASEEKWAALQAIIAETKTKLSNTLIGVELTGDMMSPAVVRKLDEMDATERAEQVEKIQKAILALSIDTTELQQIIQKANEIDSMKYTAESYKKLQEAVKEGQNLLDNGATQEQIDEQVVSIQNAIDALKDIAALEAWDGKTKTEPRKGPDCVYVTTASELAWVASQVNAGTAEFNKIFLMNDIDLNNKTWTPIGTDSHPFTGEFYGNNYTVANLLIEKNTAKGLFGIVKGTKENTAVIADLAIQGDLKPATGLQSEVTKPAGGIASTAQYAVISNCVSNVNVLYINTIDNSYFGGIVGKAENCKIIDCRNGGDVTANYAAYVGGIAGQAVNTSFNNVSNSGQIEGLLFVGGIVGNLSITEDEEYKLAAVYNTGDIRAAKNGAGIAGAITRNTGKVTVESVYNTGDVSTTKKPSGSLGDNYLAGLVGIIESDDVTPVIVRYGYNVGVITAISTQNGAALIGGLGGSAYAQRLLALEGCAENLGAVTGIDDTVGSAFKSSEWLKSDAALTWLNDAEIKFTADTENINNGYPVLHVGLESLYEAKQDAIEQVNTYKNAEDYAGLSKTVIQEIQASAAEKINAALTKSEIAALVEAAKLSMDEIPNDANYGLDLTVIKEKLAEAKAIEAKGEELYTEESWNSLTSIIDNVEYLMENGFDSQDNVDTYTGYLTTNITGLTYKSADYSAVDTALDKVPQDLSKYTDESVDKLEAAIAAVDRSKNITEQAAVDAMAKAIEDAVAGLKEKEPENPDETLDKYNLADGVYSIYGEMIKTSRTEQSMSNDAINHYIKLTVEDGKYYLTMDFHGLAYLNRFGYLAELSYYDNGYTYGNYGVVEGTLIPAEVLSTQKNADGSDVMDEFNQAGGSYAGKLYPDQIKFPLVSDALADEEGYVPLHVFVPVMEAISEGTGDQDVLLKLDWSTLKETTEDDPNFEPEDPVEQSPTVDYTDSKTGVKIHADKGVFDEGIQIIISEITSGADYDKTILSLRDIGKKFKLYNVKFLDADGKEVSPNGTVRISFPIAKGYDSANIAIYRMADDSKILVKGTVDNGYYTVITKTAGNYALVEKGSTITDAENSKNEGNKGTGTPQTGDSFNIGAMALLALASVGLFCITCATRKRKVRES